MNRVFLTVPVHTSKMILQSQPVASIKSLLALTFETVYLDVLIQT